MNKKVFVIFLVALVILPLAFLGCKGKVEKTTEAPMLEGMTQTDEMAVMQVTEPSQMVASETIPPTAAPQVAPAPATMASKAQERSKDIQKALKAAGFYTGAIDGKIGPRTKSAIMEFQKAKGLKVDGKVGPKTWSELEKYLTL